MHVDEELTSRTISSDDLSETNPSWQELAQCRVARYEELDQHPVARDQFDGVSKFADPVANLEITMLGRVLQGRKSIEPHLVELSCRLLSELVLCSSQLPDQLFRLPSCLVDDQWLLTQTDVDRDSAREADDHQTGCQHVF